MIRSVQSLAAIAVLLAPALAADTIYRTDGKTVEDVRVVEDTLTAVQYKKGNNVQTLDADKVLSIDYEKFPRLVNEALELLESEAIVDALALLDDYVDGQIRKPSEKRYKWAPAWSAHRAMQLRLLMADRAGVIKAADRLIQNFPDSRFVPTAYLAKAGAQYRGGKANAAQSTLKSFQALIESKALSNRWALECRLGLIQTDTKTSGDAKRSQLADVAREAGSAYPTVKNRALVIEGETYLEEMNKTADEGKRLALVGKARGVFEGITSDPNAEDETLAGAFTGLGECLYNIGAGNGDEEMIQDAAVAFLRVIVSYPEQTAYVPKAFFFAMRSFDLLGDKPRKWEMYRDLQAMYPGSHWASEAERYK